MSADYWLGVATPFALVATGMVALIVFVRSIDALARRGITFEAKIRDTSNISDYTLRRDIWWERSFGPIFVGGWYREPPEYEKPSRRLATRWIGLGMASGPCVMAFRKRDLGRTVRGDE